MNQSSFLPLPGIFYCLAGATKEVIGVGYQIVAGVHHALIGLDNSQPLWDAFFLPGIKCTIEAFWCIDRSDGRVIRQNQCEPDLRMSFSGFLHSLCRESVKATIVTDIEICYAVFRNMMLHRL